MSFEKGKDSPSLGGLPQRVRPFLHNVPYRYVGKPAAFEKPNPQRFSPLNFRRNGCRIRKPKGFGQVELRQCDCIGHCRGVYALGVQIGPKG